MSVFEKDSLTAFEKLLHGYQKAKQSSAWIEKIDVLVAKMTHLPNDPFSQELIALFSYHYSVLSEDIETIIDKALILREQKENKHLVPHVPSLSLFNIAEYLILNAEMRNEDSF